MNCRFCLVRIIQSGNGGNYGRTNVIINVPSAGIYPIEVDYDYWYHSGKNPVDYGDSYAVNYPKQCYDHSTTSIERQAGNSVPLCIQVSATGATSNPSPESMAETIPVAANTITSLWSNDPQVDVVDYYRIDSTVANFTYVATGPNDVWARYREQTRLLAIR